MKTIPILAGIKFFTPLLVISILGSCSLLVGLDKEKISVRHVDQEKLSLIFSHNINGETHPCGCRHFPLGGLPQVAGKLHLIKKERDIVYVDAGDTLFPTSVIPDAVRSSLQFGAKNLAKGLELTGLDYFVPGDQDFALGMKFLSDLAEEVQFDFLISNLKDKNSIKHKEFAIIEKGGHKIFLAGIIDPLVLPSVASTFFVPLEVSIPKILEKLKSLGLEANNPLHRLILISHSGIDKDQIIAKDFTNINWIIGSHSQSFTKFPRVINETQIVQVLSRNHYLGEIQLNLDGTIPSTDSYLIHEIRDELAKELNPNPFFAFIDTHKMEMEKWQIKEQDQISLYQSSAQPIKTATSCIECHNNQYKFWQKTPHSLAYATLARVNESKNTQCIQCHSLGLGKENGFLALKAISKVGQDLPSQEYWNEVSEIFSPLGVVRQMTPAQIGKTSRRWQKVDAKFKITANYANVQCLNCHDKHRDHPFTTTEVVHSPHDRFEAIQKECLTCHTPDQSPEWYLRDQSGPLQKINHSRFKKYYKSMSCPKFTGP